MMDKVTTISLNPKDVEIIGDEIMKVASENILPEGHIYDPDFLYLKVRAVSAGEYWGPNKNADYFPEEELKKYYKTFLDAHTFKNHENKDVSNAIGDVIEARWDDKMKYVVLLIRIDRRIAPSIARGFEKNYMTDVSMGCKIKYSVCSICGNKAKTRREYCDHIKLNKHEVMPDGRRVYEINIGPKFHDISAVLNGAERGAKALGIILTGEKVASTMSEEEIEKAASNANTAKDDDFLQKVASYSEDNHEPKRSYDSAPEKVASPSVDFEERLSDIVSGVGGLNKEASEISKIADIKKEIKGKIIGLAAGRHIEETEAKLNSISNIVKMLYTDFLTERDCADIAENVKRLAYENEIPKEQVFNELARVFEILGIELSPLEFSNILKHITEDDEELDLDMFEPEGEYNKDYMDKMSEEYDEAMESLANEDSLYPNIPTTLNIVEKYNDSARGKVKKSDLPSNDGARAVSMMIIKRPGVKCPEGPVPQSITKSIYNMLAPLIEKRSFYRESLAPRMLKIAEDGVEPNFDNIRHFMIPVISKHANYKDADTISMHNFAYGAYQDFREKYAFSEEIDNDFYKLACAVSDEGIEKVAGVLGKGYNKRKAALIGAPLTMGYSKAQQAKIKEGHNVSPMNRYIAENPTNASVVQGILGVGGYNAAKKHKGKIMGAARKVAPKILKRASEDKMDIFSQWDDEIPSTFSDVDIFKCASIDDKMKDIGYTDDDIKLIKVATIKYGMGDESSSMDILSKKAFKEDDISNFIESSESYFKDIIEKEADLKHNAANFGISVAQDMMFPHRKGLSMVTSLPGYAVDGLTATRLYRKTDEDLKEDKNKKVSNSNTQQV